MVKITYSVCSSVLPSLHACVKGCAFASVTALVYLRLVSLGGVGASAHPNHSAHGAEAAGGGGGRQGGATPHS